MCDLPKSSAGTDRQQHDSLTFIAELSYKVLPDKWIKRDCHNEPGQKVKPLFPIGEIMTN